MILRVPESVSFLITAVSATMLAVAVLTATVNREPASPLTASANSELDVSSGVPLDRIDNPASTLTAMRVESSKGEAIGEVRAVEIGPDGKPKAVTVDTPGLLGLGTRIISVNAHDLVFLKARNSLVSRLTKSEIVDLPGAEKKRKNKRF